jgi:hypothetical protein
MPVRKVVMMRRGRTVVSGGYHQKFSAIKYLYKARHANITQVSIFLTQSWSTVDTTSHGKHSSKTWFHGPKTRWDNSKPLSPSQDTIVEVVIANSDPINTSLEIPSHCFDFVSHTKEIFSGKITLPVLFESKLEFTAWSHTGISKGSGRDIGRRHGFR